MMGSKGKILRFLISFGAIGLVVFMMRGKILESLNILRFETSWLWVALSVLAYITALAIISVRIRVVFRAQEIYMSFRDCYYLGFVGMFYNLFLPSAVGGDIARVYYAYKHSGKKIESATSILIDRLMGFVALITIAFLGLIYFAKELDSVYVNYCVFGAFGILLLGGSFFGSRRFAGIFKGLAGWIPGTKWRQKLGEIYDAIYGYRHHRGKVLAAILLSFAGQTVFILSHYCLAIALSADIIFWKFFILVPVVTIVSMAPSIGGLGVREAGVIYLFSRYMLPERALAYALLLDILIYGLSIASGIVYAFKGGLKRKEIVEMEMMQSTTE